MKHIVHLQKDKKMAKVMQVTRPYALRRQTDVYYSLMRSISGQQLSVKAASTIWKRVTELFPGEYPHAGLVLAMPVEKLRQAGLSYQKAGYIKNIAQFSLDYNLTYAHLSKLGDEDVIAYLTQIKGVGKWTVEMLLMFALSRKNVFPADDLGIVSKMKKVYNLKEEGKALKLKCIEISKNWEPYRTYACLYLWPHEG